MSLQASAPSPQAAYGGEVVWQTLVAGGAEPLTYEYHVLLDGRETIVQAGTASEWRWLPRKPGNFQVRVEVEDATGSRVVSDWISFRIDPALDHSGLVAFLPIENLSGVQAPLTEIADAYKNLLRSGGIQLLSEQHLEEFMFRHRVRYTGGIGSRLARALREEEGVEAVVLTSLESYDGSVPPKIALTSRLVLCRDEPAIAWIDGVGITGEDAPGLLGINRVHQIGVLQDKALGSLFASLQGYLAGLHPQARADRNKIMPRDYYLASDFISGDYYKIAVVPFLNRYARRNAGFVIPLHFVSQLSRHDNLEVVEPGLVREQLLKYRLIMQAGPSLAVADVLASDSSLGADLILSGYVFDYQDQFGTPKLDFSTRLFSGPKREVVWWSRSYASGDDGVYWFDVGRYYSTHVMLQEMVQAISGLLFPREKFRPETSADFSSPLNTEQ